jgi:hypothetical protein
MFVNGGFQPNIETSTPVQDVPICPISEEIQQLQKRILELETQKKKEEENEKRTIGHNFKVIQDVLSEKKKNISENRYAKSFPLAKLNDQELVTRLEAIYNILQNIDERLRKLENP